MKSYILFGILITLLNKGKQTQKQLAEKFEVSLKTIQRYLLELEMSGVPTVSTLGRYGGTEICGSFKLENCFLTKQESNRVIQALSSSPTYYVDCVNKQIIDKLNYQLKGNLDTKNSYVSIANKDWLNSKINTANCNNIIKAIENKHTLLIEYLGQESSSTRTISPIQFVIKENAIYLFAFCHTKQDYRLFKINRIKKLCISNQEYINCNLSETQIDQKINNHFNSRIVKLVCNNNLVCDISEWLEITSTTKLNSNQTQITGKATYNKSLLYKIISYENNITIKEPIELITSIKSLCTTINNNYS